MGDAAPSRLNRVLLVDDDVRTSHRLAGMLREDGFEVEVVRDGAAAIARLSRAPLPDTLVTELQLQHADAMVVARFGRAQRPGLRVVIVTGYPNLMDPSRFGSPPPLLFTKPVDYGPLLAALEVPGQEQDELAPITERQGRKPC